MNLCENKTHADFNCACQKCCTKEMRFIKCLGYLNLQVFIYLAPTTTTTTKTTMGDDDDDGNDVNRFKIKIREEASKCIVNDI